ncbi:MAG: IS630 family transposase [Acidobacteria bacterium]|nr:IS630 family transposase [Acidobacteriota bacterium]
MTDLITAGEFYFDLIFHRLPRLPRLGEELKTENFGLALGGGAVTTALTAARLGRKVDLVSVIGDSALDWFARAELKQAGVGTKYLKEKKNTIGGLTVAVSLRRDRYFLTYLGANLLVERYLLSPDPDFERKAADIIGLYLKPPQHATVFCVDEKSAIQALDRRDPVLPLSPGRAERHGFEYRRHGTLALFAAFDTKTGQVFGRTAARHTSAEFVAFLEELVATQPRRKEIHVILDNFSTHKTKQVHAFLAAHPRVHFHFTPTYSSWLNQVELWFAKIERDVIARGIFSSVPNLARKLMRYIRHCNRESRPVRWTYKTPKRRITLATVSRVTGH